MFVQEYWHEGKLAEPANVIYLQFAGQWHRLYFDFGIVFWRLHDSAPEAERPGQEEFVYPLVDLGRQAHVRGVVLDRLDAERTEGGSEVRFEFRNGVVIVFRNVADTTTYLLTMKEMTLLEWEGWLAQHDINLVEHNPDSVLSEFRVHNTARMAGGKWEGARTRIPV